ncbi:MAG: hypothetical protein ABSB70_03080 [Candidatus Velthaea sp.]
MLGQRIIPMPSAEVHVPIPAAPGPRANACYFVPGGTETWAAAAC